MFVFSPLVPSLVCRHALFDFNSDELMVVPRIFVYILNVCKFFIWRARNDFRFRGVRPGAPSVIENVKTRVPFHLPIHFKRFVSSRKRHYFHRQRGGRGAVASVVDYCLILSIQSTFVCPNLPVESASFYVSESRHGLIVCLNLDSNLLCV